MSMKISEIFLKLFRVRNGSFSKLSQNNQVTRRMAFMRSQKCQIILMVPCFSFNGFKYSFGNTVSSFFVAESSRILTIGSYAGKYHSARSLHRLNAYLSRTVAGLHQKLVWLVGDRHLYFERIEFLLCILSHVIMIKR